VELREQGIETPKILYKVLDATATHTTGTEVFASQQQQYKVGAESPLSKVGVVGTTTGGGGAKTKRNDKAKGGYDEDDDEDEEGLGKSFKF
jgi:hypothetical protein